MSKTVTLRLDESVYERLRFLAERDNRPLSNYIETATLRYIEQVEYIDEFEAMEIGGNEDLKSSIEQGIADAKARRGDTVRVGTGYSTRSTIPNESSR